MVRLGSKLSFKEAVEEVWYGYRTRIPKATLRRTTHKHGFVAEVIEQAKTEKLERTAPKSKATPENLLLSSDGAFIQLTSGDWVEVKTLAVGEFELGNKENSPKTTAISYFSRKYEARMFERYALSEMHRRGVDNAELVVSVNDGAGWIQNFLDYHCPEAQRINDFSHSVGYLAQAGKAIYGEGDVFKSWFENARKVLKTKPPRETIGALNLLQPKAKSEDTKQDVGVALHYLETRLPLIDYAHFKKEGYPIGSGMVESAHKVVVQRRMKGAGMRWGEHHVNGMLALRGLVCNSRWEEGWSEILNRGQPQYRRKVAEISEQSEVAEKLMFSSVEVDEMNEVEKKETGSSKPKEDHPWRNNKWPSYEDKWLN